MPDDTRIPRAFISYSWDSEDHRNWTRGLAARLRSDGINVTLDQWHAAPGDQLPEFMERAIRENDFVLVICTTNYKNKSEKRIGGVGYEGDVITGEILTSRNHRKFIPVLRNGEWGESAASWLLGKYYIDLRGDPIREESYAELLQTLYGSRPPAPPIGRPPDFVSITSDNASRVVGSSVGLDWQPYLTSMVHRYEENESFTSFINLRKFDSIEGPEDNQYKIGVLDLDAFIDKWLAAKDELHLAILGGYGSGKTWYCHWLTHRLGKAYLEDALSGIIPVLIPLRSFIQAADVPSVLELFWDHVGRGDFTLFKQSVFQGDVLIILDGFDEMSTDFRKEVSADNFARLRRFFAGRSKVIVTSRDTYFGTELEAQQTLTPGWLEPLDTGLLQGDQEQTLRVVRLDGFNKTDIHSYFALRLGKQRGDDAYEKVMATYDLPNLATRPILANIIVTTFAYLDNDATINAAALYDRYTQLWIKREAWRLQDIGLVSRFIQDIASEMQLKEVLTVSSDSFDSKLSAHFESQVSEPADLDNIARRIKNCSFLTRDASGAWSFIHKSFMEFFCAKKCYEEFLSGAIDFSDSFPLSDEHLGILSRNLNVVMPTRVLAQARFALASGPTVVRDFFSDMLIVDDKVDDFGRFLIRSRVTVWGWKFFEANSRLEKLISPSMLERLLSDFEWDYYLKNRDWYDIPEPDSPNRLEYADKP